MPKMSPRRAAAINSSMYPPLFEHHVISRPKRPSRSLHRPSQGKHIRLRPLVLPLPLAIFLHLRIRCRISPRPSLLTPALSSLCLSSCVLFSFELLKTSRGLGGSHVKKDDERNEDSEKSEVRGEGEREREREGEKKAKSAHPHTVRPEHSDRSRNIIAIKG